MRKFLFVLLFFSISTLAVAQLQDDFSDGDFSTNPSWSGDAGDFAVSATGQLQLNAATAGVSSLSLPLPLLPGGAMEWRFFLRENFSPSSGNYCRAFLFADSADLEGPRNGYYLQFGEALANDAVELFRQDGNTSVSVCRATDGQISSAFAMGVKVTRDEIGLWTLWLDPSGGTDYIPAATGAEGMYTPSGYFGISCTYTSGNRQNFFFDDFYAGALQEDTIPPSILSLTVTGDRYLDVGFSEIIDPYSGSMSSHYILDNQVGTPVLAERDTVNLSLVHLQFATTFPAATLLTLNVQGVRDFFGNAILPGASASCIYYPHVDASQHDLIFSEVMFEPSSGSILPDAEYVEVINRKNAAIPLKDWTLSDGSSTAVFPDVVILPYSYVILCAPGNVSAMTLFGEAIGLNSFPALNNDSGDQIELRDDRGKLIDRFQFSNDTYHSVLKDGGGWSLERIDTAFLCEDEYNWKASNDPRGGTPGFPNSATGVHSDQLPPVLLRASLADSTHVLAVLNKIPDEVSVLEMNNYSFYSGGNYLGRPLAIEATTDQRKYLLTLPFRATGEKYALRLAGNFRDCPGNRADSNRVVYFAFPEPVMKGDVVINELLFRPRENGADFAELYNSSQKVLDMDNWRIAEGDYTSPDILLSNERIADEPVLLFPGEYVVLTEDPDNIIQEYPAGNRYSFLNVPDLPDFNSTEGEIVLMDPGGQLLDAFVYSERMHFPLLENTEGVSLERLSANLPVDDPENWHSSSSLNGYATPAYQNSLSLPESELMERFNLEPIVFSPDNDGIDDLLFIRFEQDHQTSGRVMIFDTDGHPLRTLTAQSLFGDNTILVWDGTTEQRETVGPGMYLVFGEFFDLNGKVNQFKKVCAVAFR